MREQQKKINTFHEEHNDKHHSLKDSHQNEFGQYKQKSENEIKKLNETLNYEV